MKDKEFKDLKGFLIEFDNIRIDGRSIEKLVNFIVSDIDKGKKYNFTIKIREIL